MTTPPTTELRDPVVLERGRVLIHHKTGTHVRILHVSATVVTVHRVNELGLRARNARRAKPIQVERLEAEYRLYVPCRWDLYCLVQRTQTISHPGCGEVDACDQHAADYLAWLADNPNWLNRRSDPPAPDCQCPDLDLPEPPDYCPEHGTPAGRGTNMDLTWEAR